MICIYIIAQDRLLANDSQINSDRISKNSDKMK